MPHLVWLSCTRVCFPLGVAHLDRCDCCDRTRMHTKMSLENSRGVERTLERFVSGEIVIQLQLDPSDEQRIFGLN